MSTSEFGDQLPNVGPFPDWNGALSAVSSGLPDPTILSRLANEYFRQGDTPNVPFGTGSVGQESNALLPSPTQGLIASSEGFSTVLPSTAGLPTSVPAPPFGGALSESGQAALTTPTTGSGYVNPSLPGVASATPSYSGHPSLPGLSNPTAFSFLQEVRPLVTGLPSSPSAVVRALSTVKIPTTTNVAEVQSTLPVATSDIPGELSQPDSAQLGDISALTSVPTSIYPPVTGVSDSAALSFLQELRPLFNANPGTTLPGAPNSSTIKIPTNTNIAEFQSAFPGAIPGFTESPLEAGIPQVAGASTKAPAPTSINPYGFFDGLRPLDPVNVVPSLEPIASATGPSTLSSASSAPFDVNAVRRDFPILKERINGRQLVWLDNAATTHKPQAVIDRISYYYEHENSNIHRAAHTLAARSTDAYEGAREKVRRFLNASSTREIIFVRGATEGINLVAQSWGRRNIQKDDEIVITWLEHHANIVPWQMLCAEKGAKLRVAPVDNTGQVLLEEYEKLLNARTKLVSIAQVSNALGTVTPVTQMVAAAHRHGAKVLVDGAQAVSHMPVNVQAYDCDFYVFSGHKVFAPTGIGVVFGKLDVLETTPPWQGGGNMIADVTFEKTVYQPAPFRFEAGTGSIAPAVGLGAAIDYLDRIGMANIARYEHSLLEYAIGALQVIPGLHLIGTAKEKASVLSFVLDGFRTEEVGSALNQEGIAVRSGHHCAQPILRRFGLESTVRPSLALYNTCEEVDALVAAIWNLKRGRGAGLV